MSRAFSKRLAVVVPLLLACSSFAEAKKKRPNVQTKARAVRALVLPVKAKGLSPELARSLGKSAGTTMVGELRAFGVFRVLSGKAAAKQLRRLKNRKVLVPNCHEKRKCIRNVGRRMKTQVLFHLQLAKSLEGVTLTMRSFDVRSGKLVRKSVSHTTGEPDDVKRATRWLARKVSSPMISRLLKGKGRLKITCEEGGANLYLNGKSFGKRTNKSFRVGSGVFDVQVKKEGFEPFHDVVVVKPGQEKAISAVLKPIDKPAPPVVAVARAPGEQQPSEAGKKPPPRELPELPPVPEPEGGLKTEPTAGTEPAAEPPKAPEPAPEKEKELPAWAVFEKPKETPQPDASVPESKAPSGQQPKESRDEIARSLPPPEPFLPQQDEPLEDDHGRDETAVWYQSWWFWSIVSAAVLGGVGGGLYAAGVFDTNGETPSGSALITWE